MFAEENLLKLNAEHAHSEGGSDLKEKNIPEKLKMWLPRFACPECTGKLSLHPSLFVCESCSRRFPVRQGVPYLLPDTLVNMGAVAESDWQQMQAELEETYIDLNGDSFRQKMLNAAKRKSISDEVDSFFWEKRLFQNLSDPVFLKREERFTKMLKERNRLILLKLKEMHNLQGKTVLNIGLGTDIDLIDLLEEEGSEVMNCDLVEESLWHLAAHGKELLAIGDMRNLPFQTATFDLVLAIDILHHVHPLGVPVKEARRVLKQRGTLCISELNKYNFLTLMTKILPRFVCQWQRKLLRKALKISSRAALGSPYERILSRREINDVLQSEGFTDIDVSVMNYLNPVFPCSLVRAFDSMASHFSPVFSPTACRFFSLPGQEDEQ